MYQSRLFQHGLIRLIDFISCQKLFLKKEFLAANYYNNNNNNNNNKYYNSKNNVDNNSNDNDHNVSLQDYHNSCVPTESKPYTATKRNAKDENKKWSLGCSHDISIYINDNNNSENNVDNNSYSKNNDQFADSEENNNNNMDGNEISASTPTPSDSNADNDPPGRKNKNNVMRLPRFIGHQNGIVLRVFKQKQRKQSTAPSSLPSPSSSSILDTLLETLSTTKKLSASFISHPNGIVLRVCKQK